MSVDAQVAVLQPGTHILELREVKLGDPAPHEVLVEQHSFGVCHSQLDRIFDPSRRAPMLLGHESIGTVVAVGASVTYVEPGDQVFTTWMPRTPLNGRPPVAATLPLSDGQVATALNAYTWGTHAVVDEQYLIKVEGEVNQDLGSVVGCAVMTGAGAVLNSAPVRLGQSVAIWGAGGVGLCAVAGARISGAAQIIAVDVNGEKLSLARKFGATDTVNARATDPVKAIRSLSPRDDGTAGVDISFDCTGIGSNVAVSLAAVRPGVRGTGLRGGVNVLVGIPREPFQLDSFDLLNGEKTLAGSVGGGCRPERDFRTFIEWTRDGRFDPSLLVTDRFGLDAINEAVDALHHGRVGGRAVVELGGLR
jgi:Zn-dependent alcohol dehydrogenase